MIGAKEYLLKIQKLDERVDNLNADISMLEDMLYKITPTLKPDVVTSSGSQDKLGNLMADHVDKMKKRDEAWDAYVDYKMQAKKYLDRIERREYLEILRKRYFEYKTIINIAEDMKMEYRYVRKLHGRALQAYEKVMQEGGA